MADQIRIGKISSVNHEAGMARVTYADRDGAVTSEIPLLSNEYLMPEVGDQVLVVHLSNGSEAGIILGRYWNENNKPKSTGKGVRRRDFNREGTAYEMYQAGVLSVVAAAVAITGGLTIDGNLTVNGTINATGNITGGT